MENDSVQFVPMKMIVGAFIALLGLILTLDNFYIIDAELFLRGWSLFLVAIGVMKFLDGRFLGGLAWTLIGVWILLYNFGFVDWDIFGFWPIILVGFGIALVRQAVSPAGDQESRNLDETNHAVAVVGGSRKTMGSQSFSGGSATACVGHSLADLSGARMEGDIAYFDAYAFMGAIEIIVPKDWRVTSDVFPFMGGYEDKTKPGPTADRRLHIRGAVCMGAIEVKNAEES